MKENQITKTAKDIITPEIKKEYDRRNHLIFEGEYLNDKRNGKGKKYDYDGELIFEGEY